MVCLYCNGETKVINSRAQRRNNQVWRRRECLVCRSVFTTHESVELESALSVSKAGRPEPFLPDLLLSELMLALKDRKDAYTASRAVMGTILHELLVLPHSPLFEPRIISQTTARVLKNFDKQAYLRYTAEHPSLQ